VQQNLQDPGALLLLLLLLLLHQLLVVTAGPMQLVVLLQGVQVSAGAGAEAGVRRNHTATQAVAAASAAGTGGGAEADPGASESICQMISAGLMYHSSSGSSRRSRVHRVTVNSSSSSGSGLHQVAAVHHSMRFNSRRARKQHLCSNSRSNGLWHPCTQVPVGLDGSCRNNQGCSMHLAEAALCQL
jgi:type IV secretory pathway TrbL component